MHVLAKIPLSRYSGYGNDGLGLTQALLDAGVDVRLNPTAVQPPISPTLANLLTKDVVAPFDMIIIHLDPGAMEVDELYRSSTDLLIGWTMWEYETLENLDGKSSLRRKLKAYDAIVAYDDVTAGAFRKYYSGPILVQQGGYWASDWTYMDDREWDTENFYMFMLGQLSVRKNPFAAVQAFSELKQQDKDFDARARLSLKTNVPGLHSKMEDVYPGLRIFYDVWPTELVKEFYKHQHLLLAPSWGEGKNMPALEFMSTGGSVAATNWGGMAQWLNPAYSYPIEYDLEVTPWDPRSRAAKVRNESLKEIMLHAFRNRDEVREKGIIAARTIPGMSDWAKVMDRFMLKLDKQFPDKRVALNYEIAKREAQRNADD